MKDQRRRSKAGLPALGRLVRHWRRKLDLSQEQLAREVEVSVRHLSFVETGRSAPSRELVIAIACKLGVQDIGLFLEAAGFVAPYPDDLQMEMLDGSIRRLIDAQPLPCLVHDRFGTVHHANDALYNVLRRLGVEAPFQVPSSGHNVLSGLRPLIGNWDDIVELYSRRLFRELVRGGAELQDQVLEQLYDALGGDADDGAPPQLLVPLIFQQPDSQLRFEFATTTLGVPQDILLRNFRMVLFMPADKPTHSWLAEL